MIMFGSWDDSTSSSPNTGTSWAFITNKAFEYPFPDSTTAVFVEGSVELASNDGNAARAYLGICYQSSSGGTVGNVGWVYPNFIAPTRSFFPATVSGVIRNGNLPGTGEFFVGLCMEDATSNLLTGHVNETSFVTETGWGAESSVSRGRSFHIAVLPGAPRESEGESQNLPK